MTGSKPQESSNEETLSAPQANVRLVCSRPRSEERVIDTWYREGDSDKKSHCEVEEHYPFWVSMIAAIKEPILEDATVLDFGCSRGGFLDALYETHRFGRGVGIDISREAIETARTLRRPFPATFVLAEEDAIPSESINFAFSYEVIWLLKDLVEHATFIRRVLPPGGVYYAATGCHTAHPRWNEWKNIIEQRTMLPPANHSPEDFARVFKDAGFKVSARKLAHQDFVPVGDYPDYFPTVQDSIDYYAQQIVLFRFEKIA